MNSTLINWIPQNSLQLAAGLRQRSQMVCAEEYRLMEEESNAWFTWEVLAERKAPIEDLRRAYDRAREVGARLVKHREICPQCGAAA